MKVQHIETTGGVRIAAHIYGELQGEALVISPGLGATHEQWAADAGHFSSIIPCVVVEPRSHGASTSPANPRAEDYTMPVLGRDCAMVCEQLGLTRIDFLGNSLGGLIGLEMIRQGAPLRSLITFGTTYELHFKPIHIKIKHLMQKLIGKKRFPNFVARTGTQNPAGQDIIRSMYSKVNLRATQLVDPAIADYNYVEDARNFSGKILIIRGAKDKAINTHIGSTLEALNNKPGFKLVELGDAGHFANLDDPAAFRAIIDPFLRDVRAT